MKLHFEILPKEQKEIYPYLKVLKDMDFTLFGGTALALQLGHRESVDFDFFTHKDISKLQSILLSLNGIKVGEIMLQIDNTLSFMTTNNVKISFFGNIEFVKFVDTIQSDDGILQLASLKSLLITKLKVTCDRAEYKDYKDKSSISRARIK
ncbi:nucleotidyl transferase AbiEii/AbiGii toxin family protein [Helicobacter sp. 23-1048]